MVYYILFTVGRRELYELRKGYKLAVVRGLRCGLQQSQQLAVDSFHRTWPSQQNLHRNQVYHQRLFSVPRQRLILQGDLQPAILRIRRGYQRTASLGTRILQINR